jgi:nucleoside-diphosphate-sugar epimerase
VRFNFLDPQSAVFSLPESPAMRVFLTGATGYIGRVLARRLVETGHEVRALVRPTSRSERVAQIEALGALGRVAAFTGDVADRASMREGMSGADWVIHAAADLDPLGPPARMREANVAGSDNVAGLAYKLGVGRFLSVSSVAAFGGSSPDGSPAGESSPPIEPFPTLYSATKHAGQEAIRAWAQRGLRVNTVFPSLVYGPPGKKEGSNAFLRQILKGRYPALVGADRKTSWIFLDDLVTGLLEVVRRAPPGRDFIMAGDTITLRDLVARVAALGGARPPRWSLPVGLARTLVAMATPLYRARGRRPPVSAEQLRNLERHWAFDDSRARQELDWHPRGLAAGLPPTIAYLQSQEV